VAPRRGNRGELRLGHSVGASAASGTKNNSRESRGSKCRRYCSPKRMKRLFSYYRQSEEEYTVHSASHAGGGQDQRGDCAIRVVDLGSGGPGAAV
jgi:hypothetical protein